MTRPSEYPEESLASTEFRADPAAAHVWLDVDLNGTVFAASAAARAFLANHRTTLYLRGQVLHAPSRQFELVRLLAAAWQVGVSALALPRAARLPMTLRCAALAIPPAPPRLRLTLVDPEALGVDPTLLQPLFGLTRTEAAVAAGLAEGLDTARLAQAMGVQPNTVLNHVKKVLTKTGTRRQPELVSLLLRSAACVARAAYATDTPAIGGEEPRGSAPLAHSGSDTCGAGA